MAAVMTVSGLCSATLQARPARQTTRVRSGYMGQQLGPVLPRAIRRSVNSTRRAATMDTKDYPSNWIRTDPLVFVLGFLGWTLPTNLGVPIFNGGSFFGEFMSSIGRNLGRFPNGPPLNDPFWLYLTVYHAGLFLTLFLGQIGVQGRRQGYWN
ncbi:hypothetical protein WJX79_002557 [Trebouxia sp. C0005]|nr:MAG: photosystem I subunit O [Trebouxia sp. A1-2]